MNEIQVRIFLNLLAAPFGFSAWYYGYKGYKTTRGGLSAYKYYFLAMTAVGAVLFFDLLKLMGVLPPKLEYFIELSFLAASISLMLAFRDLLQFLTSIFSGE